MKWLSLGLAGVLALSLPATAAVADPCQVIRAVLNDQRDDLGDLVASGDPARGPVATTLTLPGYDCSIRSVVGLGVLRCERAFGARGEALTEIAAFKPGVEACVAATEASQHLGEAGPNVLYSGVVSHPYSAVVTISIIDTSQGGGGYTVRIEATRT